MKNEKEQKKTILKRSLPFLRPEDSLNPQKTLAKQSRIDCVPLSLMEQILLKSSQESSDS